MVVETIAQADQVSAAIGRTVERQLGPSASVRSSLPPSALLSKAAERAFLAQPGAPREDPLIDQGRRPARPFNSPAQPVALSGPPPRRGSVADAECRLPATFVFGRFSAPSSPPGMRNRRRPPLLAVRPSPRGPRRNGARCAAVPSSPTLEPIVARPDAAGAKTGAMKIPTLPTSVVSAAFPHGTAVLLGP